MDSASAATDLKRPRSFAEYKDIWIGKIKS
jgi:hypothetical protein